MSIYNASEEASTPATPSTARQIIYPKSGGWYQKNAAGVEVKLTTATELAASGDDNILVSAYASGATTPVSAVTFTKVLLATENYDLSNAFASSTFTAPSAGYYRISGGMTFISTTTLTRALISVYKNGSRSRDLQDSPGSPELVVRLSGSCTILLAANDTIELYGYMNGTGTLSFSAGASDTWLDIERIRGV